MEYCIMEALNETTQQSEIRINMCFEEAPLGKYGFLPYGESMIQAYTKNHFSVDLIRFTFGIFRRNAVVVAIHLCDDSRVCLHT